MGKFDDYRDVEMVIEPNKDALKAILKNKYYALLYSKNDSKDNINLRNVVDQRHLLIRGGDISDDEIYVLILEKSKKYFKEMLSDAKEFHGIIATYPTFSELLCFVHDKEIVFRCHYYGSFDGGDVEEHLNKEVLNNLFAVRKKKEFYIDDDFFDVRVFLRRTESDSSDNNALVLSDIRDFSINKTIIDTIMRNVRIIDEKMMYAKYAAVSKKMQSQYLMLRFYGNPSWEMNPVCIMNYRISAYILPGIVEDTCLDKIEQDHVIVNTKDNKKYVLDSIQCNTDICHDLKDFNDLINGKCVGITMA